jgi:hypothetical protein
MRLPVWLCLAEMWIALAVSPMPVLPSFFLAQVLLFINQSPGVHPPASKSVESTVSCSDKPYSKSLPRPEPACEKALVRRLGRPLMFPAHNGIAFGLSFGPDKSGMLYLWADNQTGTAVNMYACCISTLLEHIDIFDSEGHRVRSKENQLKQKAALEGLPTIASCSCSGWVLVPPHTIRFFVHANIADGYALQRGSYTISERNPVAPNSLRSDEHEIETHARLGLAISVP